MITVKILHVKEPDFLEGTQVFDPAKYEHVASMNSCIDNKVSEKTELELAEICYERSQNFDTPWLQHIDISPCDNIKSARSTSVGDVFEINSNYYVCMNIGFKKLMPVGTRS